MFLCSQLFERARQRPLTNTQTLATKVSKVFPTDFASSKFVLWKRWINLRSRTPGVAKLLMHTSYERAWTRTHSNVSRVGARTKKQTICVDRDKTSVLGRKPQCSRDDIYYFRTIFCDSVSCILASEASWKVFVKS